MAAAHRSPHPSTGVAHPFAPDEVRTAGAGRLPCGGQKSGRLTRYPRRSLHGAVLRPVRSASRRIGKTRAVQPEPPAASLPLSSEKCKRMTMTFAQTTKPTPPSVADDPRWARVVARDKTANGHLWY